MKNLKIILTVIMVIIILSLLSGCRNITDSTIKLTGGAVTPIANQQPANAATKTSTVTAQAETGSSAEEQPDDLMTVPGGMGPQYRANVTMDIKLSAAALPSGFSLSQDGIVSGAMPSKRAQTNLAITIDSSVEPGEYPLEISVFINGKDYGSVTCTVVVE